MISPECLTAITLRSCSLFIKLEGIGHQTEKGTHSLSRLMREKLYHASATNSFEKFARSLSRAPSTIYREINRNGGWKCYRAVKVEQLAWDEF